MIAPVCILVIGRQKQMNYCRLEYIFDYIIIVRIYLNKTYIFLANQLEGKQEKSHYIPREYSSMLTYHFSQLPKSQLLHPLYTPLIDTTQWNGK